MKIVDPDNPESKEYLAKLGELVVVFNALELFTDTFIWELIDAKGSQQGIGRRITVNLEFQQKLDLLRSLLVERYGQEKAKRFTNTYSKLKQCAEKRNDTLHSLWFIHYGKTPDNLETRKINFQKAYERGKAFDFEKANKKVPLNELKDIIKDVESCSDELVKNVFYFLGLKI